MEIRKVTDQEKNQYPNSLYAMEFYPGRNQYFTHKGLQEAQDTINQLLTPSDPTQSAEEYYEALANKKLFTKLTATGISGNLEEVFEFAEGFAQQPQPPAPIIEGIQFMIDGTELSGVYELKDILEGISEENILENMEVCTCQFTESVNHCECEPQYHNSGVTGMSIVYESGEPKLEDYVFEDHPELVGNPKEYDMDRFNKDLKEWEEAQESQSGEPKGKELPFLEKGDQIKLYGKTTTVEGFEVSYNDGFEAYEIILLTTGRGDPFKRTLPNIELIPQTP